MPKRSKRKAPAAAGKSLKLDKREEASPKKSMEDLPPEVVTIILEHLTRNESRNNILGYRRVNSQWKDIIGSLLEKKVISSQLSVFPVMRIHPRDRNSNHLYVCHSSTMLPGDRNPFPSNSLLLYGKGGGTTPHFFPESVNDILRMSFSNFMSTSGSYLTILALEDVVVPGMHSLVTLLSSLSSLKVLRLDTVYFDDEIIKSRLVFPTAPILPNFTNLQVKHGASFTIPCKPKPGQLDEKRHILYVWLIASYADQLLHLKLETYDPLPPLQRGMNYFYPVSKKQTLSIGATSDQAFRYLKELRVKHPNKMFMRESQLPKLERICITALNRCYFECDIQDVTNFIGKCRSTLMQLRLDVLWNTLKVKDEELKEIMPPPIIGRPFPKLKTLEVHYSPEDDRSDDIMISSLLVLFPALETLHLLRVHESYPFLPQELGTVKDGVGNADKIVAAKSQLAALEELLYERTVSYRQQRAAIPPRAHERIYELNGEMDDLRFATYRKRAKVFKQLAALGVTKQEVLVEQLLEREGIWNICPNLKLVSVSSGRQPDGDLYVFRRPVEV